MPDPAPSPSAAAPPLTAHLRCFAGCAGRWPLDEVRYRCPSCDGLLEVAHDLAAIAARPAAAWRALFEQRWRSSTQPWGSGVWGKKEWVHPGLPLEHVVSAGEGATPLLAVPRYAAELGVADVRVKQCGTSHTGSFKDLGMTVLVSTVKHMIAAGRPVRAVACASTGDTSAALAAYAAAAGVPAVVLLPRGKISTAQLVQPLANGALVVSIDTDFDGCMRLVQQLAEGDGLYLANSMNSIRIEGQKTVAIEIVQQLDWSVPDWIIIPGGNLGNVSALGAGLDLLRAAGLISRVPRLCVAQAAAASPLHDAFQRGWGELVPVTARPTLASAIQIGHPVSFAKAVRALQAYDGVVCAVGEAELADAGARADRAGLFTCPHTAVALGALEQLVGRGLVEPSHQVVVVSTASGLKFTDSKVGYHDGTLASVPAPRFRNTPVEVGADLDAVRRAVLGRI
jgi:threonine synthase